MCIMRNLSYHVHKEVPGAEKFHELEANQTGSFGGSQKKRKDDAGCFGGKKAKGVCERQQPQGTSCASLFILCGGGPVVA